MNIKELATKTVRAIFGFVLDQEVIAVGEVTEQARRPYLVEDLLLAKQVSVLAGPSNLGKSSVVACIASHLVLGKQLGDRKVTQSAVLYLAAEDSYGIIDRSRAYMSARRGMNDPYGLIDAGFNLGNSKEVQTFTKDAEAYRQKVKSDNLLIVIDTLNLCIGSTDENDSTAMGNVMKNAQSIAKACNAHVMIVHHVPDSNPEKPRGANAVVGNADSVLILCALKHADEGQKHVFLKPIKQRSVVADTNLAFTIEPFTTGIREDGKPETVPSAIPYAIPHVAGSSKSAVKDDREPSLGQRRAAEVLAIAHTFDKHEMGLWFSKQEVEREVGAAFEGVISSKGSLQKAVSRALMDLCEAKAIEYDEDRSLYRLKDHKPEPSYNWN